MQDHLIAVFFKLICICLGESKADFPTLTIEQWRELYVLSHKQALTGILSEAISKLPEDKRPPREILFKWLLNADKIKQLNNHINKAIPEIETLFKENNFRGCVLKGQGIAQLYPYPELRTPGDVDIWIDGKRENIISFINRYCNSSHAVYHHIDGLKIDGIEVETHFTPSYMSNPFANKRLQKWIVDMSDEQFKHSVNIDGKLVHIPTLSFNRVFILHHIYRHFFYEGIGLRQMMDLYYVFKQGFTEYERVETLRVYASLNLTEFAGAAIYVLHEIFGLEEQYHIVAPNEEYGKTLLSEIIIEGNFGQIYNSVKYRENKFQRGWRIIKRSWRFVKYAPTEVLWLPYFKLVNNMFYVKRYKRDCNK